MSKSIWVLAGWRSEPPETDLREAMRTSAEPLQNPLESSQEHNGARERHALELSAVQTDVNLSNLSNLSNLCGHRKINLVLNVGLVFCKGLRFWCSHTFGCWPSG
jgi:hypothetical protein